MWGWGTIHTQTCMLACKHIYCFVIFFLSSSRGYILGCCKGFWIYLVTHGWCLWIYLCVFINNCFCVISMYIHVQIMYVCLCICISPCSAKKSCKNLFCCSLSHQSTCHFNLCGTSGCIVVYFGGEEYHCCAVLGRSGFG